MMIPEQRRGLQLFPITNTLVGVVYFLIYGNRFFQLLTYFVFLMDFKLKRFVILFFYFCKLTIFMLNLITDVFFCDDKDKYLLLQSWNNLIVSVGSVGKNKSE